LSLIALFGLYMRLLDYISRVNSRCEIAPSKHLQPILFHSDGIERIVSVSDHPFLINQY